MTIKSLSSFLKDKFPGHRRRVPAEFFARRRIAIDGHLLSYAYMSTAIAAEAKKLLHSQSKVIDQKSLMERWLGRWLAQITILKEARWIPIVVLDGGEVPVEKTATRAKRNEGKLNVREELKGLEVEIAQEDLSMNMSARERRVKLMARDVHVTEQHFSRLRKLLETAGVSMIQARGEGEALCASLVKEGKCYAVLTQDSDCGTYLAPVVIISIENPTYDPSGRRYQYCEVIYYRQVMSKLGLTPEQYIDFCIMCGTDYNDNVPNWGPAKCYKLIQEYGSLEKIPVAKYDTGPLNYQRVREIFAGKYEMASGDLHPPLVDIGELTRVLAGYGLLRNANRLLSILRGSDAAQINQALAVAGEELEPVEMDPGELL